MGHLLQITDSGKPTTDSRNRLAVIKPTTGISLQLQFIRIFQRLTNFRYQPVAGSLLPLQIKERVSGGKLLAKNVKGLPASSSLQGPIKLKK
jgi:hypothetical protein